MDGYLWQYQGEQKILALLPSSIPKICLWIKPLGSGFLESMALGNLSIIFPPSKEYFKKAQFWVVFFGSLTKQTNHHSSPITHQLLNRAIRSASGFGFSSAWKNMAPSHGESQHSIFLQSNRPINGKRFLSYQKLCHYKLAIWIKTSKTNIKNHMQFRPYTFMN